MRIHLMMTTAMIVVSLLATAASAQQEKKAKGGIISKTISKTKDLIVEREPPQPVPDIVYPQTQPAPRRTGSLFFDGAAKANLFDDFKARHVGDLITIRVVEATTASVKSDASRLRDSGSLINVPAIIDHVSPGRGIGNLIGGLGEREFKGAGATSRSSQVQLTLSARVVSVLPNGDLVIEGSKVRAINKETEMIVVRGIVRPRDISANNVVLSTAIADMSIQLNGKGVASADNQPGWLYRFLSRISPF